MREATCRKGDNVRPPATSRFYRSLTHVGVLGLCLFSFFVVLNVHIARIGVVLMLLSFMAGRPRDWRALLFNKLVILFGVFLVYVIVRGIVALNQFPSLAHAQYLGMQSWLMLGLCPIVAWWSGGDDRRILYCLVLAGAGTFVKLLIGFNGEILAAGLLHDQRVGPGFTLVDGALAGGSVLLWCIALAPKLLVTRRLFRWTSSLAFLLVTVILVELLVMNQTRSVWGGAAILAAGVVLVHVLSLRDRVTRRRYLQLMAITILAITASVGYFNSRTLSQRLDQASHSVALLSSHSLDNVPFTSLTARLVIWRFGIEQWAKRPLFGWGPGTDVAEDIPGAPVWPGTLEKFTHVHNGYLQVLVRFGLVGFAFFVAIALALIRSLARGWRSGEVSTSVALALLSSSLLAALVNITDVGLSRPGPGYKFSHFPVYVSLTILLVGLLCGVALRRYTTQVNDH